MPRCNPPRPARDLSNDRFTFPAQIAATRIVTLLARKGGRIGDVTVGGCVEFVDAKRRVRAGGGQKKADFYLRMRAMDVFPEDAPATIPPTGHFSCHLDDDLARGVTVLDCGEGGPPCLPKPHACPIFRRLPYDRPGDSGRFHRPHL